MGIHEGKEEVLAAAHYSRATHARYADRTDARISSRTLRVYLVLEALREIRLRQI